MNRQVVSDYRLAASFRERLFGLLGRSELPQGQGLWLQPCAAVHTVGMRFAIDLVFLDRDARIIRIDHNVAPGRVRVCWAANSVLELSAGRAHEIALARGQHLSRPVAQGSRVLDDEE
jgi:uncharacterized protein